MKPAKKPAPAKAPAPAIPLTDSEISVMGPYLQQAASATRAYQSASVALDSIAKAIAGRAGAPPEQRFRLDIQKKQLVPLS